MIILDSTLKSLEIVLDGAVTLNQLDYVLSYVDLLIADQSVSAVGENDGTTNDTTPVVVLAAPAAGHSRQVKFLSIPNKDTSPATVTIQYNDNGTKRRIFKATLAVDDNLVFTD